MATLPDVEGLREKIEVAPGFCCRGPGWGGPLFGVSRNRFSFNIKFRFTVFGPMHSSMAARAESSKFFISLLRASLSKWFLSPHVKYPSFPFLEGNSHCLS